jgi:uncharacterized protein
VVVVDTNVFVYAADADSAFHRACRTWLERQQKLTEAWYTTWPILYEFVRVTTHPRVMRRPWSAMAAMKFVKALLSSPGLQMLVPSENHALVIERLIAEIPHLAGNVIHDAHTAALMREHGIRRICTRNAEFHRFAFLEVIDPMAG